MTTYTVIYHILKHLNYAYIPKRDKVHCTNAKHAMHTMHSHSNCAITCTCTTW